MDACCSESHAVFSLQNRKLLNFYKEKAKSSARYKSFLSFLGECGRTLSASVASEANERSQDIWEKKKMKKEEKELERWTRRTVSISGDVCH